MRWLSFFILLSFNSGALLQAQGGASSLKNIGGVGSAPILAAVSSSPAPEWGTSSDIVAVFQPTDFLPQDNGSSSTWEFAFHSPFNLSLIQTSVNGPPWLGAVKLPTGAVVQRVELEACDTSTTGAINFSMGKITSPPDGSGPGDFVSGTTGTTAAPGCALFSVTPGSPVTIQNASFTYYLFFLFAGDFNTALQVQAMRVYYRLQVSPAPASATFADVPTTHLFFQYVEALAAAGITSGCGGGNFCPDAAVTRGQMAVFLSKALGLHWTP